MNDYPIVAGSALFTLVDPSKGHEVAYNRWYERDHFYAGCMIGPWLFSGRRFVATRELKDLRFPEQNPVAQPGTGSYLAIYWVLEGHEDEHFQWASEQVHWLYDHGRGFAERSHVHTVLFDHQTTRYREADPVPLALALDHPYRGLVSVFLDRAEGVDPAELDAWLDQEGLPGNLTGTGVASAASFAPRPREGDVTQNAPMDLGSLPGGPERSLQLFFLETDPREIWDTFLAYGDQIAASGLATLALAAPFLPTIPGTDRYTDELW